MQVVGALKHETISLVCGIQSKPAPTNFHWTFNNSGELVDVPSTRYSQVETVRSLTNQWHGSRLNYTPSTEMDYGTVACWARNRVGRQKNPCLFQIIVAGRPYPLHNCTAVQSTGPYAYRMGKPTGTINPIKLCLSTFYVTLLFFVGPMHRKVWKMSSQQNREKRTG